MRVTDLTFDEIISYGELGEISITSPEDFQYLERLVSQLEDVAYNNGENDASESYDSGFENGKESGYTEGNGDGIEEGYQQGLNERD